MTELNVFEKKVVDALISLEATSEDKMRNADKIAKEARLPKGKVGAALQQLVSKGIVKRVARQKAAGYYLLKKP